jgi:hypothetical protein
MVLDAKARSASASLQAGAEEVSEQVVIAPPAAHLVQRHHE